MEGMNYVEITLTASYCGRKGGYQNEEINKVKWWENLGLKTRLKIYAKVEKGL